MLLSPLCSPFQVIFINNALSGAIFLVAGFVNSPFQTCCALTALLSSTLAAAVFNLPQGRSLGSFGLAFFQHWAELCFASIELLDSGIYGYNAYLTGMGIALFQESGVKSEWNGLEVSISALVVHPASSGCYTDLSGVLSTRSSLSRLHLEA